MANSNNAPLYMDPAKSQRSAGDLNSGLPLISMGLDSVRAYQFEMHFELPSPIISADPDNRLTLAAKQVTAVGFTTEDIEVNRVNDKVFYPGKASPEEVTVTFDNFYQPKIANVLWNWFSTIYNPVSGKFNGGTSNGSPQTPPVNGWKAQRCTIVHLDAQGQPLMETRMFGVFPTSWKTAEFNYGTNDFHTIEMSFKYDFMEQDMAGTAPASTARAL